MGWKRRQILESKGSVTDNYGRFCNYLDILKRRGYNPRQRRWRFLLPLKRQLNSIIHHKYLRKTFDFGTKCTL